MKYHFTLSALAACALSFFAFTTPAHAALYNASGLLGQADFTSSVATTTQSGLNNPENVAIDTVNHRLFVSDYNNNRVLIFTLDESNNLATTTASYVLGQTGFTSADSATNQSELSVPAGLAYDPSASRLFVADDANNRVLVFDVNPSTITNGEDAENVLGQANFTSSTCATTQSGFCNPLYLAYDSSSSRLFVTDASNRVLVFDAATSSITNGEDAENVLGQANFTSSTYATTQSELYFPAGLAYDPSTSRLFVTDDANNRVLVFDAATSSITDGEDAENVLGQANFTSSTYATTQSELNTPAGLAYDPSSSRLFVADDANNRILVFDAATSSITDGEDAENVLGQVDFTSADIAATQSGSNAPSDLAYDPSSSRLFVADQMNSRVLQYSFIKMTSPLSSATGTVGTPLLTDPINTTSSQGTVSFALASGSLPNGLTLSTSTGVISGTPTVATSTSLTIEADDTFSTGKFFDREPFTLVINPVPPAIPPAIVIVPIPASQTPPASSAPSTISVSSSSPSVASLQSTLANLEAQLQSLIAQEQEINVSASNGSASPSSITPPFLRNLSLWMTGDDVHALQAFLNTHGYPVATSGNGSLGHETFTFGNKTYAALVRFQKDQGIPATGFFGPITRVQVNALEESD